MTVSAHTHDSLSKALPMPESASLATLIPSLYGEGDTLLSPQQLAMKLGVTTKTLERWRQNGEGPAYVRLSAKMIRYRPADVAGFVQARLKTNTTA